MVLAIWLTDWIGGLVVCALSLVAYSIVGWFAAAGRLPGLLGTAGATLGTNATILGGILMIPIQYLWLLSHGPTGYDERKLVFGLLHNEYQRLSIIPLLLVLPGIHVLHILQRDGYGRLGKAGFRLTMAGYIIMLAPLLLGLFFENPDFQAIWAASFAIGLIAGLLAFLAWFGDPTGYGLNPETVRVFLQGIGFIVLGAMLWGENP